jgi:hypothetical protein
MFDRQRKSETMSKLKEIEKLHHKMNINYELKLDPIREQIIHLTSQQQGSVELKVAELTSLKTKLDKLEQEHLICHKKFKAVESLYFAELRRRWAQIPEASQATNAWLFDPALASFSYWLESQDGIYLITGKVCF